VCEVLLVAGAGGQSVASALGQGSDIHRRGREVRYVLVLDGGGHPLEYESALAGLNADLQVLLLFLACKQADLHIGCVAGSFLVGRPWPAWFESWRATEFGVCLVPRRGAPVLV
jgi:hypothetical protein